MTSHLNPRLEDEVSAMLTEIQLGFAALAFVIYDWVICLDEEIHCFWSFPTRRKLNAAALLYGLTRYSTIAFQILMAQSGFLVSETAYSLSYGVTVDLLPTAAFSAIRIYALSPDSSVIVTCTFLLLFVPGFIILIVGATGKVEIAPSPFNCSDSGDTISEAIKDRLNLDANSSIITVLDIAIMILFQDPDTVIYGSFASLFLAPVTMALTCRFLLDLHQANRGARAPSLPSRIPSLNFAAPDSEPIQESLPAFIASMGSLVHMPEPTSEEDVAETETHRSGCGEEVLWQEDEEFEIDMTDMSSGQHKSI
ncbi:hypothetical protein V8D89_012328 [Ganoderma adspersum]